MSPTALIHLLSASAALLFGAWQLLAIKRGLRHRVVGYLWVAAMLVATVSSFGLRSELGVEWLAGFSPIHALSLFTLLSLAMAVRYAIQRNFRRHRGWVAGAYAGLAIAGLFAALVPGRVLHTLVFVELPRVL